MSSLGRETARLDERGYRQLRAAAATYRQELLVRLGGEAGLRPAEMTAVTPGDLTGRRVGGHRHAFLEVPAVGSRGAARTVYLDDDLRRALERYARSNDLDEDDAFVSVTSRRVQMLLKEVGERAAGRTGRDYLADVSPGDLRDAYARRLLVHRGIDPRVVKAQGGWSSLDKLAHHFTEPTTESVVAAFDDDDTATPRLEAVVGVLATIADALPTAGERATVERTAVERLAGSPAYEYAWVGAADPDQGEVPREVAGVAATTVAERVAGAEAPAVYERAVRTGTTRTVTDGVETVAVVPLAHDAAEYGVLAVASDDPAAFGAAERRALDALGSQVAHAVTAVQRQRLLVADAVVELELRVTDGRVFFVDVSDRLDCRFDLQGLVPTDDGLLYFLTLERGPLDRLLAIAEDTPGVEDVRLVRDYSDGSLLEVTTTGGTPEMAVIHEGGTVQEMEAESGVLELTCEFAPDADVRQTLDRMRQRFPGTELLAKREVERGVQTTAEYHETVEESLTEKQLSVLRAAYLADYFAWPRGTTAEELAASMGISPPTLHNHLRKGQRRLLEGFFDRDGHDR